MTLAAARDTSAATTRLVDVDRTQMIRGFGRLMSTSCIQPSLAIRIPVNAQRPDTKLFCFQEFIAHTDIWTRRNSNVLARVSKKQDRRMAGLEPHENAANDPLRGTNDQQFVIDRAGIAGIAEHVAHANEHLPPRRAAERHEGEPLVDLHVEAVIE